MYKKKELDWEFILRKLKGQLTEEEEIRFQEWIKEDQLRQHFWISAKQYDQINEFPQVNSERVNAAWKHFSLSRSRQKRNHRYDVIRWSVAALVILSLGVTLWLRQGINDNQEPVFVTPVLSPGSNKACLILSTGKSVSLDSSLQQRWTDRQAGISLDSAGKITYQQLSSSATIAYNTLRIPQGGEYQVNLSDGTRIWLNAKTDLTYPVVFNGKERRVKLTGEAYFEVARNEEVPFIVEIGKMEVKVLGTSFNVHAYPDESEVVTTLVTGKVEIHQDSFPDRVLRPAEQALWNRDSKQLRIQEVNTGIYTYWRDGKFVFRDNSLESVMQTLARWYDMEYKFQQPELRQEKFYGVISRYADVKELLNQFEKTGKVRFRYEGKTVIVKK